MFNKVVLAATVLATAVACGQSESSTEAVRGRAKECRVGDFTVRFSGELPSSVEVQGAGEAATVKQLMDIKDAGNKVIGRVYRANTMYVELNNQSEKISIAFKADGETVLNGSTSLRNCK